MRVLGERLFVLLDAEDEFRRSQHDGDHRLGTGLPGASRGLGGREDLGITLDFGRRGRATEGAAHEEVHHRAGAVVALLGTGEIGEPALQFGARIGGPEQLITVGPEPAARGAQVRRRVGPGHRERVLTGRQLDLRIDLLGPAAGLHLQRLRAHRLAVHHEVDDGRLVAGIADAHQVGAEDVFALARGVKGRGQRRVVEDPHLILGATAREHVVPIDIEHIELLLRRRHGAFGDDLGRGDEPLQVDRRERQHIADVVEAVARIIGGEIDGEIAFDVAQVTDGVVVLRVVEAADGHLAGVDFFPGHRLTEQAFDLLLQLVDLRLGRSRLAFRRGHLAGGHLREQLAPHPLVAVNPTAILMEFQVEVGLGLVVPVTVVAVLLEERLHPLLEVERRGGHVRPRPDSQQEEASQTPGACGGRG